MDGYKNLFTNIKMNYMYIHYKCYKTSHYGTDTIAKGALKSY